ncbi:MAG: hemin uptake protein HemP [Rhodocyclaceae bacterium]|nr:hemin uptake protein HemP [Rhodocyclaceae bacterium]
MSSILTLREAAMTVSQPQARPAGGPVATQSLDTRRLFADSNEIAIAHGAEIYRLRLTRQNRLILTK